MDGDGVEYQGSYVVQGQVWTGRSNTARAQVRNKMVPPTLVNAGQKAAVLDSDRPSEAKTLGHAYISSLSLSLHIYKRSHEPFQSCED